MHFPVAETALAVTAGRLTEAEALAKLLPLGYARFDLYAWLRAARQPPAPGYGERLPSDAVVAQRIPAPAPRGRHEGGNLRRPRAANAPAREPHPRGRGEGGRFESAATRP